MNSNHNLAQVFDSRKKSSRLDLELAIVPRETPGLAAAIRVLELSHDRARREAVCCEPLGVEHDSYLPGLAPNDLGLRNVVERLE